MKKIAVGILGATGLIGKQYIRLLDNHPWFDLTFQSSSQTIEDTQAARQRCSLIFSCLPTQAAKIYEEKYAEAGFAVISSASHHRLEPDIPLLIPEINADHLGILEMQKKRRGWKKGFIVAKPNCAVQPFLLPLSLLHRNFGLEKLFVTTMQAISGAGLKGLSSLAIHDNVIPHIENEEEKIEKEPLKILGKMENGEIIWENSFKISAQCNRVSVLEGHLAALSFSFKKECSLPEILNIWECYQLPFSLPSCSQNPICYSHDVERPQPRLDKDLQGGMAISLGRLRSCPLLQYKCMSLAHNTIRGGAGSGLLIAELLYSKGCLHGS